MSGLIFLRARRRPASFVAAALLACAAAGAAGAAERGSSERLYTKGLAELHAGHTDAAIQLFQQAVDADPQDMHSLYYRALGYGHAGRFEEAAADLKAVVAASDPSIERDRLELGYVLYRLERYDEAAAQLEIAAKSEAGGAEATMLLGLVETRRGNQEAAGASFARVANLDSRRAVPARYYQGVAAYRAGDDEEATRQFIWVRDNGANTRFAIEAEHFLARMQRGGNGRNYYLHAGFALEYDSNVALAPDDQTAQNALDISGEDDGRAVMTAGGKYSFITRPNFHLAAGYDFLQSLHFNLDEFDVQTHRVGADTEYLWGALTVGLTGYYEHSLLDGDSLLNGGVLLPWVRYDEGSFGRTEAYYRARGRNFVKDPYSPVRDSWNHAFGARQFFSLGSFDRNIIVGFRYDRDVADVEIGEEFNYDGYQFEGGVEWMFPCDLRATALYAYKLEDYWPASVYRDDDEHTVRAALEKRLTDFVWMTASYVYRRNVSDQTFFEYSRHITSLGVEVRY